MPANYCFSDLQPLLPFAPIGDDAPFPWQAGDDHVLYMADDQGLWLRVPDDNIISAVEFETITGFRRDELGRKKAGSFYIYTLNDGGPLLPFPFTAAQLKEFEKRTRIFSSDSRYYGDGTDELIAEIAQSNPKAAELARAVVYGELLPEQTTAPVSVAAVGASGGVEPDKAGPATLKAETVPDRSAPLVAAADVSGDLESDKAGPVWSLKASIQRTPGYRWPIYKALKDAYIAGQPCPKAQHLLDTWKLTPPNGLKVIQFPRRDELEYELETGAKKYATVKKIQAVIKGLLSE